MASHSTTQPQPENARPATVGKSSEFISKTYTFTRQELDMIEEVRLEQSLVAESAALRWLIRAGFKHRAAKGE